LFDEALDQSRELLGDNHLLTPAVICNLSMITRTHDPDAALKQSNDALDRFQTIVEGPHLLVARCWHEIAVTLLLVGQLREAQCAAETALSLRTSLIERPHSDVAASHRVLAEIAWAEGDAGSTRLHLDRALEILDSAALKQHLERAHCLELAAQFARASGDRDAASSQARGAAEIFGSVLGAADPRTIRAVALAAASDDDPPSR